MAIISGSDGFRDSMPGICAECFAAQTRDPHPPFYHCLHNARLAVQCDGEWHTIPLMRQQSAEEAALNVQPRKRMRPVLLAVDRHDRFASFPRALVSLCGFGLPFAPGFV